MQLDLFEKDENILMNWEIQRIKESTENVRRGIFFRHNELAKKYLELKQEIEAIRSLLITRHK